MKKLALFSSAVAVMSAVAAAPAVAEDEISANVAITSDYVFRGLTQSDEDLAIQGGFDYAHDSGFYIGTWASSVANAINPSGVEIDYYGGYAGEFGEVGYDVGVLYYDYPGSDVSITEIYGSLSYSIATLYIGEAVDADPAGSSEYTYVNLAIDYEINDLFTVGGSFGHTDFDLNTSNDYDDYRLYVATSFAGVDLELAYTDTDLDQNQDAVNDDGRFVVTVSKSF